jgi:hypothetical protein
LEPLEEIAWGPAFAKTEDTCAAHTEGVLGESEISCVRCDLQFVALRVTTNLNGIAQELNPGYLWRCVLKVLQKKIESSTDTILN